MAPNADRASGHSAHSFNNILFIALTSVIMSAAVAVVGHLAARLAKLKRRERRKTFSAHPIVCINTRQHITLRCDAMR